jgi:5-methylcytosine-specific restriction enzyme A
MKALLTTLSKLRPGRAKVVPSPKRAMPFYLSDDWRSLIATIKRTRGYRCYDPDHPTDQPRGGGRIYGDHIIELKDGGAPLDPRNIMLRCHACHTRKTMRERTGRMHNTQGGRSETFRNVGG